MRSGIVTQRRIMSVKDNPMRSGIVTESFFHKEETSEEPELIFSHVDITALGMF